MWGDRYGLFREINFLEAEDRTRKYIVVQVKC
jgi:hypothetical protein